MGELIWLHRRARIERLNKEGGSVAATQRVRGTAGETMHRRSFLCGASAAWGVSWFARPSGLRQLDDYPPAYSVIPVVGDGKWVWTEPPQGEVGYLEPRQFDVRIGIKLRGQGDAGRITATTPVPIDLPEQEIEDVRIETQGAAAKIRKVASDARQLMVAAASITSGQTVGAVAHFRLRLYKQYHAFKPDQFPAVQQFSRPFRQRYLFDSPGIQTQRAPVKKLAAEVGGNLEHPWEKAQAFYEWVWKHIEPRIGEYTSVVEAIRDRVGDCEERAGVFVALCRVSGIPARLVWVPNHSWAEFYLRDHAGQGHWIPAHTSAYSWFGWTGAHELVLQKGDRIHVPEKRKPLRLLTDWMQWQGRRPRVRYLGEVKPVAAETGGDAGPGARSKDERGEWVSSRGGPLDRHTRV